MKRIAITSVFAFVLMMFFSSQAMAQNCSGLHDNHRLLCPDSSWNLFGASYNPVAEDWGWYVGAKTVFFHPARYVWVGGIGLGIAFSQSENNKHVPVFTFVPVKIGSLAIETSLNKVSAVSPPGERKRTRLVMLTWNWRF